MLDMLVLTAVMAAAAPPAGQASSDTVPGPGPGAVPSAAEVRKLPPLDRVIVRSVRNLKVDSIPLDASRRSARIPVRAGLGDRIQLRVSGLRDLVNHARCMTRDEKEVKPSNPKAIALFLDGRELKGIEPESGAPRITGDEGTLEFHLERGQESDETWADLLGGPIPGKSFFYRPTEVNVGLAGSHALTTDVRRGAKDVSFELIRIREGLFWASCMLVVGFFIMLRRRVQGTNLIRDYGTSAAGDEPRPYSLARWQMAWWFILTVASYAFIFIVTGAADTITASTLGLLGISAATFLGSVTIEARQAGPDLRAKEAVETQRKALADSLAGLEGSIKILDAQISAAGGMPELITSLHLTRAELTREREDASIALRVTERQLTNLPVARPLRTRGFLDDILEDATGPSIHRYQMFIWTIVLGILFVVGVWKRLAMPEFSTTLLGLMGISGGTYIGYKLPAR